MPAPITYQLQISRELNQYSTEDSQYVKGLPGRRLATSARPAVVRRVPVGQEPDPPGPDDLDNFEIVDTQGNTYYPVKLNTQLNPFAWTSRRWAELATEPGPNTVASLGPTQGGLLLFKVNNRVYSNRPLTLYILGASNRRLGGISLNL